MGTIYPTRFFIARNTYRRKYDTRIRSHKFRASFVSLFTNLRRWQTHLIWIFQWVIYHYVRSRFDDEFNCGSMWLPLILQWLNNRLNSYFLSSLEFDHLTHPKQFGNFDHLEKLIKRTAQRVSNPRRILQNKTISSIQRNRSVFHVSKLFSENSSNVHMVWLQKCKHLTFDSSLLGLLIPKMF